MKKETGVVTALIAGFSSLAVSAQENRPSQFNILFLTVDDLKPDMGCYGDKIVKTPNIDKIAAGGTLFMNNQCQQAICAPSRISMFTGMRPDSTKVWDFNTHMREVNPDVVTIPECFKKHGYETAGLGKLMHGAKNNDPQSWTIPYKDDRHLKYATEYGYPASGDYLNKKTIDIYSKIKNAKLGWRASRDYMKKYDARPPVETLNEPDSAYVDGAIADEGIRLMKKFAVSGKPFFLALGFHKPHLPFIAPKRYWDMYKDSDIKLAAFRKHAEGSPECAYHKWPELRYYSGIPETGNIDDALQKKLIHGYYACVSYVDAQIGRVVDELNKLGLAKKTIIILWGDHGWHLGDHGLWCKQSNFEQATRAPLIISVPHYKGGQKVFSPTEFVDIFPTLCALTGIKSPEGQLEGVSLVPLLKDPNTSVKKFAMSQYPRDNNKMGYSLRTKRYRYTQWIQWDHKRGITDDRPIAVELYDYETDPLEKVNLAANPEYKEELKRLSDMMTEFLKNRTNN